jgi:hypothetical protein
VIPVREIIIPATRVRSLAWIGDSLVDRVAGGVRYELDGSSQAANLYWAYGFDSVATVAGSDVSVLYARLETKAIVLKGNTFVRELNRSFYHSSAYPYPVCLVKHSERTLLIHCPDEYNRLEIEEAESGLRLTTRSSESAQFFHSRLAGNPSGTRLLSAGWAWQPWDSVVYFDVDEALRNPAHLDSLDWCAPDSRHSGFVEESSACWQTDTRTIVTGGGDEEDSREAATVPEPRLHPFGVIVYDTTARTILSSIVLSQPAGTIMPAGETHIVSFYRHPRLIRLANGAVEHEWPALASGEDTGCLSSGRPAPPPMAFDPARRRFAIAQDDGIHVVELSLSPE